MSVGQNSLEYRVVSTSSEPVNIVVQHDGKHAMYFINGSQITYTRVGDGVVLFEERLEVRDPGRIEFLLKYLRFVGVKI